MADKDCPAHTFPAATLGVILSAIGCAITVQVTVLKAEVVHPVPVAVRLVRIITVCPAKLAVAIAPV